MNEGRRTGRGVRRNLSLAADDRARESCILGCSGFRNSSSCWQGRLVDARRVSRTVVNLRFTGFPSHAGVVKLADARDSKSRGVHSPCRFDSDLRHHLRSDSGDGCPRQPSAGRRDCLLIMHESYGRQATSISTRRRSDRGDHLSTQASRPLIAKSARSRNIGGFAGPQVGELRVAPEDALASEAALLEHPRRHHVPRVTERIEPDDADGAPDIHDRPQSSPWRSLFPTRPSRTRIPSRRDASFRSRSPFRRAARRPGGTPRDTDPPASAATRRR